MSTKRGQPQALLTPRSLNPLTRPIKGSLSYVASFMLSSATEYRPCRESLDEGRAPMSQDNVTDSTGTSASDSSDRPPPETVETEPSKVPVEPLPKAPDESNTLWRKVRGLLASKHSAAGDFLRQHELGAGMSALALLLLSGLVAAGLFAEGGLEPGVLWSALISGGLQNLLVGILIAVSAWMMWQLNRDALRSIALWAGALFMYLIAGGLILLNEDAATKLGLTTDEARAQAFAVISVALLLALSTLGLRAARQADGSVPTLSQVLDPRTSAGSTIILLWTGVVVYGVALIGGSVIQGALDNNPGTQFTCDAAKDPAVGITDRNCVEPGVWTDYLILLGIPGAATALTKLKGEGETVTGAGGGSTGGENKPDGPATTSAVADLQYLVFNAFAMLYVLSSLIRFGRLPQVPDILLALSGASALIYALDRRSPAKEVKNA